MTAPRAAVRRLTLGVAVSFAIAAPAAAQDAHYWTYGYGSIGQLTEGALVGGVNDLSAAYYNPGALALLRDPRFTVTLTSVELASIDVPDAAGQDLDFDSLVFDLVPAMFAGRIGSGDGPNQFGFAVLSRHDLDWDLGYSDARVAPGAADATAGFGRVRQRLLEYWGGVNWSRRVGDTVAVGVTPFVAYRAQRSRRSLTLEQLTAGQLGSVFVGREYEYNHVRVLAKAGVAWRPNGWELGATLTTPGFKVWSDGKSVFNASLGSGGQGVVSASTQAGLDSTFRAPWSVAGGATWRRGDTAVHTTVEWFTAVDPYEILSPEPAPVSGTSQTFPLTFTGAAEAVVNLGAGLEHRLNDRLTLYGGVARNASSWTPEAETLAVWDLVDVTAGFAIDTSRARLAFGASYSWGSGELPRAIAPPDLANQGQIVDGSYSRWTFSVGASTHGRR